jgi:hypothetical protein
MFGKRMKVFLGALTEYVLESPGLKTLFSAVLPVISGVLSGTFILEITTGGTAEWALFYRAPSFYGLCIVAILTYWYNRELFLHDQAIERFTDASYCVAYMRSKCLPEAAERYRELIRNGAGGELLWLN